MHAKRLSMQPPAAPRVVATTTQSNNNPTIPGMKTNVITKPLSRFLLAAAVAAGSLAVVHSSHALLASDNASNYSGSFIGDDFGTGMQAWTSSLTGSGGSYVGASGLSASNTWAIYSGGNAGNSFAAYRKFDTAMAVGDTFSIEIGYTGVDSTAPGEIGINLYSGGAFRLGLKFTGGGTNWQLNDGGSDFTAGNLTWSGGSPGTTLNYSFTRGTGNTYSLSLTQGSESYSGINNTSTSGTMDIDEFEIYSSAQGSGENVGFDNISVVPEPSTYALLGLGAAFGLWHLRRRRSVN